MAIARSLGDFWSLNYENNKYVVSPEPDVKVFNIDTSKHRCLIFGTDGVWNVLSSTLAISNIYETDKFNIEIKEVNNWLLIYVFKFIKLKTYCFLGKKLVKSIEKSY